MKVKKYVCSDKCYTSLLPLTDCDDIDFECAFAVAGLGPCNICKRECIDDSEWLTCYVCDAKFHCECRYEDPDAYKVIKDNKYIATCSDVCDIRLMPFNGFKFT